MKLATYPNKIVLKGENYFKTKELSLPELALVIETNLLQLANSYFELTCAFEISFAPRNDNCDGLKIKLVTPYSDALVILQDEITQILGSYNQQILVREAGRICPRYCRFYYNIEFEHKKLSVIKGGA